MNTNDKTLADVQPGGRVRLGDQAELDRLEFQAWARELLPCPFCGNSAEFVPYKDNGLTLKCTSMGCVQRNQRTLRYGIDWLRTSMTEHWNARALSAQPSPGGQGNLKSRFTEWVKANSYNPATFASGRFMGDGVQIAWEAVQALAARQPVGEPAMYQVRPRSFPAGEGWREVSKRQFDDRGDFPGYPEAEWERRALYAAPPAQAVDLGKYRHALLRASGWARRSDVTSHAEDAGLLRELLALIDSQAVGNGN